MRNAMAFVLVYDVCVCVQVARVLGLACRHEATVTVVNNSALIQRNRLCLHKRASSAAGSRSRIDCRPLCVARHTKYVSSCPN
jgi:hypothetical protein